MPNIRFLSTVFCEEVRREYNGGAIIIGAKPAGPAISAKEGLVVERFGLYLEVILRNLSTLTVRFWDEKSEYCPWKKDLKLPSIERIQKHTGVVDPESIEVMALLVVNERDTKFLHPGTYSLQFLNLDGLWETIRDYEFPDADLDEEKVI